MVNRMLCALAASSIFSLAACAQGSGGDSSTPFASYCDASFTNQVGSTLAPLASSHQDPFEAYGKVLFDNADTGSAHAPYINSLLSSTANEKWMDAGTEVAVTLRQSCQAGEISTSVSSEVTAPFRAEVMSYTWRLPRAMSVAQLNDLANADECVVGISEARKYFVNSLPNDPQAANQGHLVSIEAGAAYDVIYPALAVRPVVIAVIDTGIDVQHPYLRDVLWKNSKEIAGNGLDDDKNGYADDINGYNFADDVPSPVQTGTWSGNQHGTHVAGLAAAESGNGIGIAGVMGQGSRIMMLNVFGKNSGAYVSDIANAIRYAVNNGADVINMSLGGSGRSATYEAALAYAVKNGVTVVVAAGNEASETGGSYFQSPSSYSPMFEGMLAVASTDSATGALSTYSNYSAKFVEISAPGSENSRARRGLLSTWTRSGYARIQGTSMASPVVAGAAGLAISMLRSRGYEPSPATIEGLFAVASVNKDGLRSKVQAGRALNLRVLAEYINKNYPVSRSRSRIDPGVPGYKPCQVY